MFSREARRRNKEAFLQKIGAHQSADDEDFVAKAKAHEDLEARLDDARKATYEYACALHALTEAGGHLATALEAVGAAADDGGATAAEVARIAARRARGRNHTF